MYMKCAGAGSRSSGPVFVCQCADCLRHGVAARSGFEFTTLRCTKWVARVGCRWGRQPWITRSGTLCTFRGVAAHTGACPGRPPSGCGMPCGYFWKWQMRSPVDELSDLDFDVELHRRFLIRPSRHSRARHGLDRLRGRRHLQICRDRLSATSINDFLYDADSAADDCNGARAGATGDQVDAVCVHLDVAVGVVDHEEERLARPDSANHLDAGGVAPVLDPGLREDATQ